MNGERFCNELAEMSIMNCYLRSAEDQGNYCQVFDADYMEKAADFPGGLVDPEGLKNYMPEEEGEKAGVLEGFIGTFKADTLEELAAKLEITDVDAFVATVERCARTVQTPSSALNPSTSRPSTRRPSTASTAMCA